MFVAATAVATVILSAIPEVINTPSGPGLTCAEVQTAAYGHIQSENGNYASGVEYCWLIRPEPPASVITLSFHKFKTERAYDALHVFDGTTATDRAMSHCTGHATAQADGIGCRLSPDTGYSGSKAIEPLSAYSGAVLLIFQTDLDVPSAGFTFAWTSSTTEALPSRLCATDCADDDRVEAGVPGQRANGVCDEACFNAACNWDGDDCEGVCDMATGARRRRRRHCCPAATAASSVSVCLRASLAVSRLAGTAPIASASLRKRGTMPSCPPADRLRPLAPTRRLHRLRAA
jgi:hypothetical protein